MKRLIMTLAMAAAVAVGLLLPYGVLMFEDWNLEKPSVLSAAEPEWTIPSQDSATKNKSGNEEAADYLSDAEIAHRLSLFGTGGIFRVPLLKWADEEEREWAISRATAFMEALCEQMETQGEPYASYSLEIFDSGENVDFWFVQFTLTNEWHLTVLIDRASGVVLQFYLMGVYGSLADIFPESARIATDEGYGLGEAFESQVALRVASALEEFICSQTSEKSTAVWFNLPARSMTVNLGGAFDGYFDAYCETYFEVNTFEGIFFNNRGNVRPVGGTGAE